MIITKDGLLMVLESKKQKQQDHIEKVADRVIHRFSDEIRNGRLSQSYSISEAAANKVVEKFKENGIELTCLPVEHLNGKRKNKTSRIFRVVVDEERVQ